jgi:hypothetical protein
MIKRLLYVLAAGWLVVMGVPGVATAQEGAPIVAGSYGLQTDAPVIITELQTASSAAGKSDEFIELYNSGDEPVDITGWQLRYSNASSEASTPTVIATVTPGGSETVVIMPAGGSYVLHTPTVVLAEGVAGQAYEAKLSNADKAIMLLRPDPLTCLYAVEDSVGWGTTTKAEGAAVPVPVADKNAERYLQRYRDPNGHYLDTNTSDFDLKLVPAMAAPSGSGVAQGGSPGALNGAVKSLAAAADVTSVASSTVVSISGCVLPEVEPEPVPDAPPLTTSPITEPPVTGAAPSGSEGTGSTATSSSGPYYPAADIGLAAPQLTEVLPNPAAPQTDSHDEFIELYNSNASSFDLSGFSLEIGTTTKRRYTFPQGTALAGLSFKAYFSVDTKLSLSNSGSTVRLLDPFGNAIATADPYTTAKDGQAWARANGIWSWTTTPTPNAPNAIAAPVSAPKKAASTSTTKTAKSSQTATAKAAPKNKSTAVSTEMTSVASIVPDTPLHPTILVGVGAFALLYGAYEYRHDLGNYFYRIRRYREIRRETRQES